MTLHRILPSNPERIDEFIEPLTCAISNGRGLMDLEVWICGIKYHASSNILPEDIGFKTQAVINDLYHAARPHFQAFADALAQQPIEVEPLELDENGYCQVFGLTFRLCRIHDGRILAYCGSNEQCFLDERFGLWVEAREAINTAYASILSAQLGRPVVVKQTPTQL